MWDIWLETDLNSSKKKKNQFHTEWKMEGESSRFKGDWHTTPKSTWWSNRYLRLNHIQNLLPLSTPPPPCKTCLVFPDTVNRNSNLPSVQPLFSCITRTLVTRSFNPFTYIKVFHDNFSKFHTEILILGWCGFFPFTFQEVIKSETSLKKLKRVKEYAEGHRGSSIP